MTGNVMGAPVTTVRRPMFWDAHDFGYYPAPQVGVDYVEEPARSCLYVPCERFRNKGPDGRVRSGWNERCALYRLLGRNGLLYVGIGMNPEGRWAVHRDEKPWWPEVLVKTVDWHEDRGDADIAEYLAIKHEKPRYNVIHWYPRLWRHERHDAKQEIDARFK